MSVTTRFRWAIMFAIVIFAASSPLLSAFPKTLYVDPDLLNAREDPFPDAPVGFKLDRGTEVIVLDSLNGWGAIKDPDRPGETFWISLQYLSESPVGTGSQATGAGSDGDFGSAVVGILILIAVIVGIIKWLQSLGPLARFGIMALVILLIVGAMQ